MVSGMPGCFAVPGGGGLTVGSLVALLEGEALPDRPADGPTLAVALGLAVALAVPDGPGTAVPLALVPGCVPAAVTELPAVSGAALAPAGAAEDPAAACAEGAGSPPPPPRATIRPRRGGGVGRRHGRNGPHLARRKGPGRRGTGQARLVRPMIHRAPRPRIVRERQQLLRQLVHALVALVQRLGQRAGHHGLERAGDLGPERRQRRVAVAGDGGSDGHGALARERGSTGDELVEDHA